MHFLHRPATFEENLLPVYFATLFHEPKTCYVAHTFDARLLATDADLFDAVSCLLEDMGVGSQIITRAMVHGEMAWLQ